MLEKRTFMNNFILIKKDLGFKKLSRDILIVVFYIPVFII